MFDNFLQEWLKLNYLEAKKEIDLPFTCESKKMDLIVV